MTTIDTAADKGAVLRPKLLPKQALRIWGWPLGPRG